MSWYNSPAQKAERRAVKMKRRRVCKRAEKIKKKLIALSVVIILIIFIMIFAVAAALESDENELGASADTDILSGPDIEDTNANSDAESKLLIVPDAKSEAPQKRVTVTVFRGGYEYATCNAPVMTAGELLSRLDIEVTDDTVMSCAGDEIIYDGMTITIGKYTTETYLEIAEILFGTSYKDSQTIPKGETKLISAGKSGKNQVTHEITLVDGVAISDEITATEVIEETVDEVLYRGVGGTVTANDGTVYTYSYYIDVVATAYAAGGTTATGKAATDGIIAVDPKVISYGTKCFVTGSYMEVGVCSAEDCGNFKGNHIDICMSGTRDDLLKFGRRNMRVYILE